MRYRKIFSSFLAAYMFCNCVLQAIPAGALVVSKNTAEKIIAASNESANPITVASGNAEFIAQSTAVTLGENTESDACGEDTVWTYDMDSHILVISGSGAVTSLTYKSDKFLDYCQGVETIIVESDITSLNEKVFQDCTTVTKLVLPFAGLNAEDTTQTATLETLFGTFPESLSSLTVTGGTTIPENFCRRSDYYSNTSVSEVILADSIQTIGTNAFYGCGALTEITLPASLETIGDSAFSDCNSLAKVVFNTNLKTIQSHAFSSCALVEAVLPESIETLGEAVFSDCTSMTYVYIPATITAIGSDLLNGCYALERLALPAIQTAEDNNYYNYSYNYSSVYEMLNCQPENFTELEITGGTSIPDNFCSGSSITSLMIPNTVTEIGDSAFRDCSSLEKLSLPASVTKIGNNAFAGCSDLTAITIPGTVKEIGESAFSYCSSVTLIQIAEGTEVLQNSAFSGCSSAAVITLPSTLTAIGEYVFSDNNQLKELIVPENVKSMGRNMLEGCNAIEKLTVPYAGLTAGDRSTLNDLFYSVPETLTSLEITGGESIPENYCNSITSLTELKLSDSITSVGNYAFDRCENLADITMSENITQVGNSAFSNTAWYDANDNGIVYAGKTALSYKGKIPSNLNLKFKDGIVGIADYAFYDVDDIASVTFPKTLENIGNYAFYGCNGLTKVTIPDSVSSLGSYAFAECASLENITLSENIAHIGSNPFSGTAWDSSTEEGASYIGKVFVGYKGDMNRKTSLVLKDGTTEISAHALDGYENLISITIPDTVVSIGSYAFNNCTGLKSVSIPNSVTSIGENAFSECTALQSVGLSRNITKIEPYTFDGCLSLISITIPDSVTEVGDYAFRNNKALKNVTLSDNIKEMGSYAFDYDFDKDDDPVERTLMVSETSKSVTSTMVQSLSNTLIAVELPDSIVTIGDDTFSYCENLKEIIIPEAVASIGDDAFYHCTALQELNVPKSVKTIGNRAFQGCDALTSVTLNEGLTAIGNNAFAQCSQISSLSIPDSVKTINDYAFSGCTALVEIKLPSSLKKISAGLFEDCKTLTSVTVPYGTETIDEYAFRNCDVLTKIVIPDTIKEVHYSAYDYSSDGDDSHPRTITLVIADNSKTVTSAMTDGLENIANQVILPASLTTIGEDAFYNCSLLSELTIPENVTMIERGAFQYCSSLNNLLLPKNLKELGTSAFASTGLKTVTIPDKVTSIPESAFSGCKSLESVTLSKTLKTINRYAFADCSSLKSIVIPEGTETISEYAFLDCDTLSEVTIPSSILTINSEAFDSYYTEDYADRIIIFAEGTEEITSDLMAPFHKSAVKVVLPETVTTIGNSAFQNFERLEEINLPESITSIGTEAFWYCTSLRSLELPDKLDKISQGLCYSCISLESVKLPAGINKITDRAFYGCESLKEIISDVQDFRFRSTSFTNCYSLLDPRFMILDKRNINLSANTDTVSVDGIVNFSLSYKLTPFLFEDGAVPVLYLHIPSGMELINSANFEENYYDEYEKELKDLSGTLNFSCRVTEYGKYNVSASLGFSYDDETWNETIGTVEVQSPMVSISAPVVINTTSVQVKGFAKPGEEVSVFVDDAKSASITANEKTGRYTTTVNLRKKESGESYQLYAAVDGENTSTVSVLYAPEKPMVEAVYLNYNGGNQHMDITSVFTEGKRPVISYNPSYPFEFEIEMSKSENVSRLYVTSQKGDDIKSIEAKWNAKKQLWVAFGYFDSGNTAYVPGALNISVYERNPVTIDVSEGVIHADTDIMREIYSGTDKSESEWSNQLADLPQNLLPENVEKNTTSEITYESDDAVISDFHVSDGIENEDITIYMDTSNTIYIGGEQITAEQVAKNPEAYGFTRSDLTTVDENGNAYNFYTHVTNSPDAALQVYNNFEQNGAISESNTNISVGDMLIWRNAVGTQTLRVPANKNSASEGSIFTSALTTVKDATSCLFLDVAGEDIAKVIDSNPKTIEDVLKTITGKEDVIKLAKNDPAGFTASKAWNVYDGIQKTLDILETGSKTIDRFNKLNNIPNSAALKVEALTHAATKTAYTLVASKYIDKAAGTLGAKVGAAIGSVFCPGVGSAVGGIIGYFGGKLVAKLAADAIFNWWGNRIDEKIAFAENGYMTVLIDPSGFVFEAVKRNRVPGAKMTIYYKDPETGEEMEWTADDYDQKNPLTTDENGEYAWDVPEGLWRVKFEKEGYETVYSEWMDVPPVQTGVNFSVTSLETPEVISAVLIDGIINVTFSKYMDAATVTNKSVSIKSGKTEITGTITPVLSEPTDAYTNIFNISGKFPSGKLSVEFSDTCKSYSGTAMAAQSVTITVPETIVSIAAEQTKVIAAQNQETEITVTAKPASMAVGKKLIVTNTNDNMTVSEAVFNENGIAVVSVNSALTGSEHLILQVEDSELTTEVTFITVTQKEYDAMSAIVTEEKEESTVPAVTPGDVNGDGQVTLKDAVLIRRYIAGGWDVELDEKCADVNGDGTVNLKDVVLIRRYIAGGWNVTLDTAA